MKSIGVFLVLIVGCCAPAETPVVTQIAEPQVETLSARSKVVRTLTALSDFDLKAATDVIDAVEKNDKKKQSELGAAFVKSAYERAEHGLDTTECKIIWKAVLVSCKTKQDGFEMMNVSTPWLGKQ